MCGFVSYGIMGTTMYNSCPNQLHEHGLQCSQLSPRYGLGTEQQCDPSVILENKTCQ